MVSQDTAIAGLLAGLTERGWTRHVAASIEADGVVNEVGRLAIFSACALQVAPAHLKRSFDPERLMTCILVP
jgi:hypothetical protein